MIETERLVLLPATVQTLRAEARRDLATLASLLSVAPPEQWPPGLYDDDAIAYFLEQAEQNPGRAPWHAFYLILKRERVLVGTGGFVSPPDKAGSVELGYSIVDAHRRHGYASEAVAGMVARAFSELQVRRVIAHTYPDLVASIGVLEKNGFKRVGAGAEAGTVRYERRR